MLGALLAVLSAATFALNNASVRRGVLTGTVGQAMAITVPLGVPLFFLAALVTGHLGAVTEFSPKALIALALAGILHFVWGRYCNYRATRAIGANLVAPIQQVHLIISLSLAIWLLGNSLPCCASSASRLLTGFEHHHAGAPHVSDQKINMTTPKAPGRATICRGLHLALLPRRRSLSLILVRCRARGQRPWCSPAGGSSFYRGDRRMGFAPLCLRQFS